MIRRGCSEPPRPGWSYPKSSWPICWRWYPSCSPTIPDTPPNPPLKPEAEQQRQFESVVAFCSSLTDPPPYCSSSTTPTGQTAVRWHAAPPGAESPPPAPAALQQPTEKSSSTRPGRSHEALLDLDRNRLAARFKLGRFTREETHELLHAIFEEDITPEFLDGIFRQTRATRSSSKRSARRWSKAGSSISRMAAGTAGHG